MQILFYMNFFRWYNTSFEKQKWVSMTESVRGIVQGVAVPEFDQVSPTIASWWVYTELVPRCESQGIRLSYYGNTASERSIVPIERYTSEKAEGRLFDIDRIQQLFTAIGQDNGLFNPNSVSGAFSGEIIAVMLLHGYRADFTKGRWTTVGCSFNNGNLFIN